MHPDEYNRRELAAGNITPEHLTALTSWYQTQRGLPVDGKLGPTTRAALVREGRIIPDVEPGELRIVRGWLEGPGVQIVPAHPSWYCANGVFTPAAIMAHYTDTDPGTAEAMARRRIKPRQQGDRAASWHITVAQDGTLWQMVPLTHGAWHCTGDLNPHTAGPAWRDPWPGSEPVNLCTVGVELEGRGDQFPAAQVEAACRLWRALVQAFPISRELAMLEHSNFDPDRRHDPGPVWMKEHAPRVLGHAFS